MSQAGTSGMGGDAVTVGVDIGTTSVKALAVNGQGQVMAHARVPHSIVTTVADQLEHDAGAAWRRGPKKAFTAVERALATQGVTDIAGVSVAAMVPSLTAVNRRGVPLLPGLLYGDIRGQQASAVASDGDAAASSMVDAEGFLGWAAASEPEAAGYWPCQAVATKALTGVPAIDTAVVASLGSLHVRNEWNTALLEKLGARTEQMPVVVPMCAAGGTLPGRDTIFTGGTVDALCDQIVSGATEPGDVLAIFGATLVIWVVTDSYIEVPGLVTYPHTVADRFLIGGPSNAGALFVDWARHMLRGVTQAGPTRVEASERTGDPDRVPVWLPYLRGERSPFNDASLRSSIHGLDITQGPEALARAAYEASGFVIRRMLELTGVEGRRIVASGGGTRARAWMAGVADGSGLPVDTVAVPEGAAYGAAFFARLAAGLAGSLDESQRWAGVGRRVDPDPVWSKATSERYRRFADLGPFS